MKQINLLANEQSAYGGDLLKSRKGRLRGRPLATKNTMHLVLRSTKAKGPWNFRKHQSVVNEIIAKFAQKFGVKVPPLAKVGNHLPIQIQLTNRQTWKPFIRAITAAIAMKITGFSRWKKP